MRERLCAGRSEDEFRRSPTRRPLPHGLMRGLAFYQETGGPRDRRVHSWPAAPPEPGRERAPPRRTSSPSATARPKGAPGPRRPATGSPRPPPALAAHQPELQYANLAVRGRRAAQIRAEQIAPALALRPRPATATAGSQRRDPPRSHPTSTRAWPWRRCWPRSPRTGAERFVTFTYPYIARISPPVRRLRPRLLAFNDRIREMAHARHRAGRRLPPPGDDDSSAVLGPRPPPHHPARARAHRRPHRTGRAGRAGERRVVGRLLSPSLPPRARGRVLGPTPPGPPRSSGPGCGGGCGAGPRATVAALKRPDLGPVVDA